MIDTHCHLEDYEDLETVIQKMKDGKVIVSGINQETNEFVLKIIDKYENVYGTIGIHPEEVMNAKEEHIRYIEDHLNHPKIVGIGEIGLDYHYTLENKELQKQYFIRQLELAKKYKKTAVIHSRDAALDTYNILEEANLAATKIVLHCYGYSKEMAQKFQKFHVMFGIGGVLTFKNSIKLKEVVQNIDIRYLLLETDSPFLTPEPFRGKRNEPYNIIYVAQKIAEIKEISVEEVFRWTTENASSQFDLPIKV